MMNGNFQNMSGPGLNSGLGPQGIPQQGPQQRPQHIQQHIFRTIQQQHQAPQGWQTMVGIQQRAQNAYQLVSSLRLIKPDMDIQQSMSVAVTYEQKIYNESPDRNAYEQAIRQKLSEIKETRSRQAANMLQHVQNPQPQHMNMIQQQMPMQGIARGPNQAQFPYNNSNANPQLQQQMQMSGMPMQQTMMHQPPQLQMGIPNPNMPGIPQNPHQQIPQNFGQMNFSPEENQMITRMATNLAHSTPPDQLELIRQNLQNMNTGQRQALSMQNIDPVAYFFRNHVTKRFVEHQAKIAAQRLNPGMPGPGNGLMPQQPRPTSQNSMALQAQQHGPLSTPQMVDNSFVRSIDQIRVQQQDALQSQEAGQVVVPASNSQAVAESQRGSIRGTPQPPSNTQLGTNEAMPNPSQGSQQPSQYWANQQLQQPNIPQTSHMQGVPQAPNFGNIPAQPPLHGQIGGFGNHAGRIPQQNPGMPTLNKGLKHSPQPQTKWNNPRPAQQSQPKDQNGANASQPVPQQGASSNETPDSTQQRQKFILNNLPPNIRQYLATLSEDAQKEWMINFFRRHQQQRIAQQNAKPPESAQAQQLPSATQPLQNMSINAGTNNPVSAQQPVVPQQQPSGNLSRTQITQTQKSQKHQQLQARAAQAAQQAGNTLTEEQAKQMDEQNFPVGILNGGSTLSQLPPDVKTWGQLKSWVTQNNQALPPASLAKLRGLQGLHYQNLRQREQQMGQNSSSNPQGITGASAPTAPMVPSRGNGQTMPASNGVNLSQSSRSNMIQSLPPPTLQEIRAARARLPDNLKGLSDDEIASRVLKQRQSDFMKLTQAPPTKTQQMQMTNLQRTTYQQSLQQQNSQQQVPTSNNQSNTAQHPPPGQRPQPQQISRPLPASKDQNAKQTNQIRNTSQASGQNPPITKGVKRNSNDDVIEVPNPNTNKQDSHPHSSKTSQATKPTINPSDSTATPQDQKSMGESHRRMPTNQRTQAPTAQDINPKGPSDYDRRSEENARRELRLQQLMAETSQNTPARQPVAMSPEVRAVMVQKLRDAKEMVQRMEQSLPIFFKMFGDEKTTRDLIRARLLLVHQYRDSEFNPIDQLTITPDELDKCTKELTKYFHFIMLKVVQQRPVAPPGQVASQTSSRQPLPEMTSQATPESAPSLSAANLQEHEKAMQVARQASVQKNHSSHGGNRAPAAPTSPQPPFKLFGVQSPQGVPPKYATRPNELTQDRLTLPPNKKIKRNQVSSAASTPAQAHAMPVTKSPSQAAKVVTTDPDRTPGKASLTKCPVANCQSKNKGFASQEDLEKHVSEVHEAKEPPIEDPVQWVLEQVRYGLGLDENGKSKPLKVENKAVTENYEAPRMKKSASMQGPVKQEISTPMARVPTQTGPSPASNLLKTPQASSNVKTPLSEAKSTTKDIHAVSSKTLNDLAKEASASPDPWAGSLISPDTISAAWSGLSDLQSIDSWSTIQSTLTPASTLTSNKSEKNSPRVSDISENDAVKINLTVDDDWVPAEWFEDGLYGDMESLTVNQDLMSMDWETAFGQDESTGNGSAVKTAQGRVDDMAPSTEWSKIYAPTN